MLLFSATYSFNNISTLKITLHYIYIQRPPRNSCDKKCLKLTGPETAGDENMFLPATIGTKNTPQFAQVLLSNT